MLGFILVGGGAIGVYGAMTGYLPAMIAALFYPSLLQTSSSSLPDPKLKGGRRTPRGAIVPAGYGQ